MPTGPHISPTLYCERRCRRERNRYRLLLLLLWLCPAPPPLAQPELHYRVVAVYPHDPSAFTQGLLYSDGKLYESTGNYGHSELREVDLYSGRVLRRRALAAPDFGEGLALLGDRLVQLTWTSGHGYLWDRASFQLIGRMPYRFGAGGRAAQGWGLCSDGTELVLSDGTDQLYFLDGVHFAAQRSVRVRDLRGPVKLLNELECIDGRVYANVWRSDRIVIIDPASGRVSAQLNLGDLYPREQRQRPEDVMNGIAWDAQQRRLFVTGKRWPKLYQLMLLSAAP